MNKKEKISLIRALELVAGHYHDGPTRISSITEICHEEAIRLLHEEIVNKCDEVGDDSN